MDDEIQVGDTCYCWSGLIDNAINGLDGSTFGWTKNMIKQHYPRLQKDYLSLKEEVNTLNQVIELSKGIIKDLEEKNKVLEERNDNNLTIANHCIAKYEKSENKIRKQLHYWMLDPSYSRQDILMELGNILKVDLK